MPTRRTCLGATLLALAAAAPWTAPAPAHAAGALTPYRSEAELVQALTRWRDEAARRQPQRRRAEMATADLALQSAPAPAAGLTAKNAAEAAPAAAADSITNVQTAGVDEGGIVKRAGDHLVILRRGRLFTVRIGGDTLQPQAMLDAYAPGADPGGAWYDELLVSGSTVVVIGYSYARGGTEIGLFELGRDGSLAYRATWHLRSFDYYSSRNYASRLVGRKLVFYTPMLLHPHGHPWEMRPAMRRWHPGATPDEFQRILPANRIYRTDDEFDPGEALALHTVTSCELGGPTLQCESSAVLGPAGRVFYVSAGSVYVWTTSARRRFPGVPESWPDIHRPQPPAPQPRSAVFRLPLDGGAPSALKTAGVPIDPLSFLEDGGHLTVLLRESGQGEGMWGSERTRGAMALLRVPLSAFGDGRGAAQREHYQALPSPGGHDVQNRHVGDWLLWGGSGGAWAMRPAQGGEPQPLSPGHAVERIEAMGPHAVLVGNQGADLHFSAVRLDRRQVQLAGRHVQSGASQGETRTHGFFFRPAGDGDGVLGLPVLDHGRVRQGGVYAGGHGAAGVMFLRARDLSFSPLGRLESRPDGGANDGCKASCVDWYGNARPIFIGDRVFALLGYELVEGELSGGRWRESLQERRRISFAPTMSSGARYSPFN